MLALTAALLKNNLELLFWIGALFLLYFLPVDENHFSICPLSAAGLNWCPGCGLGHSIHYYLHLSFTKGWEEHYLGGFAILVILYRLFQLIYNFKPKQNHYYEQQNF